ncbi:MAG: 2Fe-2S iron-sulfur cluster-binding protein [Polyangia bacterium]
MAAPAEPKATEPKATVTVTIDGKEHEFPRGQNLLEACRAVGADVPYFCYHKGLSSPAVCRQCLVEVKGAPKPVPSCYTMVADKMEVSTSSPKILDVRRQMLEFTLLNHPIDCPICDKAGECILQRQYFDWDAKLARNEGSKVRKAKVVDIGRHIVLDQERCILCTRCIRVCDEVAKQSELTMAYRGARQVLTTAPGHRLDNPYSLNTVDVCPVGALTDKSFRFARRVWELVSVPSICPGCATGCNVEIHSARGKIHRLVPRENLEVNKFWMCDEGRFTYRAAQQDRFLLATVSGQRASLATAVSKGARLLEEALARDARKVGVVFSAGATNEDTHALARLALDGLKIGRAYLGGAPLGWSDNILVSADKNPNTAGVERIVPPPLLTLKDLAGDVASGAVSTLLVLGNASLVLPEGRLAAVVVLSSHQGPLVETANVALPVASWAEVEGSFTNRHGRVQRLNPALAARGDGLPAWRVAALLGHELSVDLAYTSAAEVFADASARHPFMQSLRWGPTARPTLLRFGASRG